MGSFDNEQEYDLRDGAWVDAAGDSASQYSRDRYGSAGRARAKREEEEQSSLDDGYFSQASGDEWESAEAYQGEGDGQLDASAWSRYTNDADSIRRGAHAKPDAFPQSDASVQADALAGDGAAFAMPGKGGSRKRKSLARRIFKVIGCLILALVVAGAAYALWFTSALDRALAPDQETSGALADVLVPAVSGKPYYVLVMGSDSREGNYSGHVDQRGDNERSDVMMLVRVDAPNKQVTILSIPRDTPYKLADGSYVKINEMFNVHGAASAVKAVSELTGVPISHHAEIRVSGLENIVDLLGGITVDVPIDMSYTTTDDKEVTIEAGRQTLNGQEAQIFARARHEYEGNQDEHRQSSVRQLMTAIIAKVLDRPINEIPGIVLQLAEYVDTDFRSIDAVALAMTFSGGDFTLYTGTGPTEGDYDELGGNKWLCYLNPEGWQKVMELVDAGQEPEGVDYAETQTLWTDVVDQPDFDSSLAHLYYYGTRRDENGNWTDFSTDSTEDVKAGA